MLENDKEMNEDKEEILEESMPVETLEESKPVENSNVEILGNKEAEEVEMEEDGDGLIFFKRVLSGVIDQIIVIAVSVILLLVSNFILKLFGFYIVEREPIFFVLYVVINVLYGPICNSSKLKKTIGLKINFK